MKRNCLFCKNEFETIPENLLKGYSIYCSHQCYLKHRWGESRRININCAYCEKEFMDFQSNKRKVCSKICRYLLLSKIMMGHKGVIHTPETIEKIKERIKQRFPNGRKMSKEAIQKLREFNMGNKYNLGKKRTLEFRMAKSKFMKEYQNRKEIKERVSRQTKQRWDNPKTRASLIQKVLTRKEMSSLEKKFNDILIKYNLPYKYVGNFAFFIERKCPDFININGQKIAIEVYYRKHKLNMGQSRNRTIEDWKKERTSIFNKYGWQLLFFDEIEVNENNVLKILGGDNHN